jgi:hypothetical protein
MTEAADEEHDARVAFGIQRALRDFDCERNPNDRHAPRGRSKCGDVPFGKDDDGVQVAAGGSFVAAPGHELDPTRHASDSSALPNEVRRPCGAGVVVDEDASGARLGAAFRILGHHLEVELDDFRLPLLDRAPEALGIGARTTVCRPGR